MVKDQSTGAAKKTVGKKYEDRLTMDPYEQQKELFVCKKLHLLYDGKHDFVTFLSK